MRSVSEKQHLLRNDFNWEKRNLAENERERNIWIELKLAFFNILEGLMALSEQGVEARILSSVVKYCQKELKKY